MRALITVLSMALVCSVATTSEAQIRPSIRGQKKRPPRNPRTTTPARPGQLMRGQKKSQNNNSNNAAMCHSQNAVLVQEQNRLQELQASIAGTDAEIAQLRQRLQMLERNKSNYARQKAHYERRASSAKARYDSQCKSSENCSQYESQAGNLERETKPIEDQLAAIRTQIGQNNQQVSRLNNRVRPLQREYSQLRCNNLVPGQTSQSTIDRCSAIFSEWNRIQADINNQTNQVPALKSRYEQLLARMRGLESRAKHYESYLAKNCTQSSKVNSMRRYGGVRQNAERMGRDLDKLIQDVASLRGVQITVEAR